ncbi:hypothetical protein ALFP_1771 [Alcaligenes faecalis]|uniref:HAD domain-containing protein n=1 Tax=Alcaligenes faecalis TaxID=511 RepID=UPI0007C57B0D|nr:HAD domain-containing protein [Alcaligenes faecalis]ARP53658.1 hypothetical protein ALFP_1771 [Alcaligenes faecalis]
MKVIFLDIDGVLNSNRSAKALGGMPWPGKAKDRDWHLFDPVAVGLLQKACEETGAVCVLSSSWRMGMDSQDVSQLAERLGVRIVGLTRDTSYSEPRGDQIADWLSDHPEVSRYAIVDDDADMLDEQKEFFVKTSFREGLLFEHYMRLVSILGLEAA